MFEPSRVKECKQLNSVRLDGDVVLIFHVSDPSVFVRIRSENHG